MNLGYFIKDTVYEDNVEIIVYSKLEDVETLTSRIVDITSATAGIVLGDEFYLSVTKWKKLFYNINKYK